MRCALLSDLHNEFEASGGPVRPNDAWSALRAARRAVPGHPLVGPLLVSLKATTLDLVILAGDIDVGLRAIDYADAVARFLGVPVVTVMGNHEAYHGRELGTLIAEFHAAARATEGRVTFLENEAARFALPDGPVTVLGCTLWTDYALNGEDDISIAFAMRDAGQTLNDHRMIRHQGALLTPGSARGFHQESRRWLGAAVAAHRQAAGDAARLLIVTHHAPTPDANPPVYRGGKLSPAFASDLRAEIAAWRPVAWCFGHTHHSLDLTLGPTRLLASQRGYIGAEPGAETYQPLVFEV